MLKIDREKVARGNNNYVDKDVLIERGRQLHSAAIGDALTDLFEGRLIARNPHYRKFLKVKN